MGFFSPTPADVRTRENVSCQFCSVCSRCRSLFQTEREKKKIETHHSGRRFNAPTTRFEYIKKSKILFFWPFIPLLSFSLFISFLQLGIHQALWRPLPLKQIRKKKCLPASKHLIAVFKHVTATVSPVAKKNTTNFFFYCSAWEQ